MTSETAPDAVAMLQWMHACVVHSENHGDVPRIGSDEVLAVLRATQDERALHAEEVERLRRERQAFGMRIEELETREDDLAVELAEVRRRMCRAFGVSESATWAELESLATTREVHGLELTNREETES